jgi:hypothetical protein
MRSRPEYSCFDDEKQRLKLRMASPIRIHPDCPRNQSCARSAQSGPEALSGSGYLLLLRAAHPSLRAQEAPPNAKLCNPTDLVHQFAFFPHAFVFIPHRAIYCLPARIDPVGERRLWQGFSVNNGRGHKYHQLAANVSSFVTCGQRTRVIRHARCHSNAFAYSVDSDRTHWAYAAFGRSEVRQRP